jgi:hypothetical protein
MLRQQQYDVFNATSPLLWLPYYDPALTDNDEMHDYHAGVSKHLFLLWLGSDNHKKEFSVRDKFLHDINSSMRDTAYPKDMQQNVRDFLKHKFFKGMSGEVSNSKGMKF